MLSLLKFLDNKGLLYDIVYSSNFQPFSSQGVTLDSQSERGSGSKGTPQTPPGFLRCVGMCPALGGGLRAAASPGSS